MAIFTASTSKTEVKKSKFNDEFEKYLERQCLKTTFNGLELETFSWYKKMLGLDIRKFEDAVTLQVILILKRLEQKRKRRTNKLTRLQSI